MRGRSGAGGWRRAQFRSEAVGAADCRCENCWKHGATLHRRRASIDALAKTYLDQDTYPLRREGEVRVTILVEPQRVTAASGLRGEEGAGRYTCQRIAFSAAERAESSR